MITFIVPTLGRPSLIHTLRSIETRPGDEILVVGGINPVCSDPRVRCIPSAPGGDWGHSERNKAMASAKGQYITSIDDDDVYAPGTRDVMQDAIERAPGKPVIFKMQYPNGATLWQDKVLRCGNVGTPQIFVPNMPDKLGRWGSEYAGDFIFIESCKWLPEEYVWREEVVALLGHNV